MGFSTPKAVSFLVKSGVYYSQTYKILSFDHASYAESIKGD